MPFLAMSGLRGSRARSRQLESSNRVSSSRVSPASSLRRIAPANERTGGAERANAQPVARRVDDAEVVLVRASEHAGAQRGQWQGRARERTDLELTRVGLDLKTAVDRFREQAANLE